MPWEPKDAPRHNRKANTPALRRQWAHVANAELARTGDDAVAVRAANSALKHHPAGEKRHGDGQGHWSGH